MKENMSDFPILYEKAQEFSFTYSLGETKLTNLKKQNFRSPKCQELLYFTSKLKLINNFINKQIDKQIYFSAEKYF